MLSTTKNLFALCAADLMSDNLIMIPREMSLQGAARMLDRAGVTGAPVVDAKGQCIGVLSATDFMHWLKDDHQPADARPTLAEDMCSAWQIPECSAEPCSYVERVMTKDPVLVPADTRIAELARMMLDAHIHRVIVVDAVSHKPMGIVSSMDILAVLVRYDQMEKRGPTDRTVRVDESHAAFA
jgi:predicted transcriptional regulator